jgi:hypothetical protein
MRHFLRRVTSAGAVSGLSPGMLPPAVEGALVPAAGLP